MKRVLLAALTAGLLVAAFGALAPPSRVHADALDGLETFDFEELSITTTATGFTLTKISPTGAPSAKAAECTVETNAAKWRTDGTAPTASVGELWPVTTTSPNVIGGINDLRRFRAIATTGTTKLECRYLR